MPPKDRHMVPICVAGIWLDKKTMFETPTFPLHMCSVDHQLIQLFDVTMIICDQPLQILEKIDLIGKLRSVTAVNAFGFGGNGV